MKFVIAAGGTGGHLFPGLAVGEVLIARGHEVMLLVSEKEIDAVATRGITGFRIESIAGIGMPRLFSPAIFGFALRFWKSLRHVKALFREFQPAAVLGMGGFTSTAPVMAAKSRGIPSFVHESNAIPGRANRLNARFVHRVLLGFGDAERFFAGRDCEVTGTPVRGSFSTPMAQALARTTLGLAADKPTILVMGGSQGAHGINLALEKALPQLCNRGDELQFIHLTGRQDEAAVKSAYEQAGVKAFVAAFHSQMLQAYSAADIAIARSGAATLAEISQAGLPSILIPYPFAADDHQTANARIFETAGAALQLTESTLNPEALTASITSMLDHPATLRSMAQKAKALSKADAAERVANVILKSVSE